MARLPAQTKPGLQKLSRLLGPDRYRADLPGGPQRHLLRDDFGRLARWAARANVKREAAPAATFTHIGTRLVLLKEKLSDFQAPSPACARDLVHLRGAVVEAQKLCHSLQIHSPKWAGVKFTRIINLLGALSAELRRGFQAMDDNLKKSAGPMLTESERTQRSAAGARNTESQEQARRANLAQGPLSRRRTPVQPARNAGAGRRA